MSSADRLIAAARAAGPPAGPRPDPDRRYKPALPEWAIHTDRDQVDAVIRQILAHLRPAT